MTESSDPLEPTPSTPEDGQPPNLHRLRSEATRARILDAAHIQFVANGLEGTRMEAIAAEAGVNKSLVYRHFGNREQLYRDVLRRAYQKMRDAEAALQLPDDPLLALDRLVSFTLQYYLENPDFLILVGIENLKQGEHLRQIDREGLLTRCHAAARRIGGAAETLTLHLHPDDIAMLGDDALAGWRAMLSRTDLTGYLGCCEALSVADLTADCTALRLPVHLIAGAEDGATPPALVQATADLMPQAALTCLPGVGHLPCIEDPAGFLAALRGALPTR